MNKTRAKYIVTVYKDKKGEYRWRLRAGNGETMADSGEGYTRKSNCYRVAQKLIKGMSGAIIVDEEAAERAERKVEKAKAKLS